MKLLFDQNITYRILKKLPVAYEDSRHLKTEGLMYGCFEFSRIQ